MLPLNLLLLAGLVTARPKDRTLRPRVSKFKRDVSHAIFPRASCEPAEPSDTVSDRLNQLLASGGAGYVLSLCPNQNYQITDTITFTAADQEISTLGYPTDNSRAMLTLTGPAISSDPNADNFTSAIVGQCDTCDGIKLRNIQINGTRGDNQPVGGGANIEFGGHTTGQVVEYVRSFDPRSWSCLHVAEGGLDCSGAIIQNNDIGPCGSDVWGNWADGLSIACANTIVRNNLINSPSDGGIVLFGSPGSLVENNTIWVETFPLLGGINMVDIDPWNGDYSGVVVQNNNIIGGLATSNKTSSSDTLGMNSNNVFIKIGIAIGPITWFGDFFLNNVSSGGTVINNKLEGAFGYAIAISSADNFTVMGNQLVGNTAFIGSVGENCSSTDHTPSSQPFVSQEDTLTDCQLQSDFQNISDGSSLTCVVPPPGGDFWPFGGGQSSTGKKVGIALGVIGGVLFIALVVWFSRRKARQLSERRQSHWQKMTPPNMTNVALANSSATA